MGGSKRKQREKLISEEFTQSLFGKESSIAATPDENIFFVDDASQKSKERKSAKAKAAPARKAAKAGAKGAASTAGRGGQSTAVAAAPSALSKAAIAAAAAEGDASSGAADWGDLGEVEACWAGGDAPCEEEGAARKKQKRSKLRQRKETAGVVMATDAPALPRPDSAFGRVVGPSKAAKAGGVLGATHKAVAALHKPIKRAAPKKQRVVKARRPKWLARYKTAA